MTSDVHKGCPAVVWSRRERCGLGGQDRVCGVHARSMHAAFVRGVSIDNIARSHETDRAHVEGALRTAWLANAKRRRAK